MLIVTAYVLNWFDKMCKRRCMRRYRWQGLWVHICLERYLVCVLATADCCDNICMVFHIFCGQILGCCSKMDHLHTHMTPDLWFTLILLVSYWVLNDIRSKYTDSVIIFKLPLLISVQAVSLQVNVCLTYCWLYLLHFQKQYVVSIAM